DDRLVVANEGFAGSNEVWILSFGGSPGPAPVPPPEPVSQLALASRVADGRVSFSVGPLGGDPATLALFDVSGRPVGAAGGGQLGPGVHEVTTDGVRLRSGLYFARIMQGNESRGARVMVFR